MGYVASGNKGFHIWIRDYSRIACTTASHAGIYFCNKRLRTNKSTKKKFLESLYEDEGVFISYMQFGTELNGRNVRSEEGKIATT